MPHVLSYSQFGEDRQVVEFFGRDHRGVFVEVGANDGIRGSNTYLLEKLGWHGVLVEPISRLAEHCRVHRLNSIVVAKAVVADPAVNTITLYEYTGRLPSGEPVDSMSAVGRPSPLQQYILNAGAGMREVPTPAATLDEILREANAPAPVDFVSIDVEGLEADVLQGFSIERYTPRLFIIEDNSYGADPTVPLILSSKGYERVHRTGVNDWYVHAEDVSRFSRQRTLLPLRMRWLQLTRRSKKRGIRYSLASMLEFKRRAMKAGDRDELVLLDQLAQRQFDRGVVNRLRLALYRGAPPAALTVVGLAYWAADRVLNRNRGHP